MSESILDEFDRDSPPPREKPISSAQSRRNKKFYRRLEVGGFDRLNPKWKRQLRANKAIGIVRQNREAAE